MGLKVHIDRVAGLMYGTAMRRSIVHRLDSPTAGSAHDCSPSVQIFQNRTKPPKYE